MKKRARRKPLGLSPRGEAGLRWLEPEVLPLAYWPTVSYNYDMNTPPDYQTIRIWTRTLLDSYASGLVRFWTRTLLDSYASGLVRFWTRTLLDSYAPLPPPA